MTTSISGVSSGGWNPLQQLQSQLQQAVSSGTVKSEDQDALTSALSDIDTQLKANATSGTGRTSGQGMKSTIDDLIAGEVSSGKLTDDQASELKSVFSQAAQEMHGHHGPPPPPQDGSDSDSSSDDATTVQSAATSFVDFLKQLETKLADAINNVTGTSATDGTSSSTSSSSSTASADSSTSSTSTASNDPKQLMLDFIKKLESALTSSDTYGASGTSASSNSQSLLVNAFA